MAQHYHASPDRGITINRRVFTNPDAAYRWLDEDRERALIYRPEPRSVCRACCTLAAEPTTPWIPAPARA